MTWISLIRCKACKKTVNYTDCFCKDCLNKNMVSKDKVKDMIYFYLSHKDGRYDKIRWKLTETLDLYTDFEKKMMKQ